MLPTLPKAMDRSVSAITRVTKKSVIEQLSRRKYLTPDEQILVLKERFGLTHGKGKRKKKNRKGRNN